MKISLALQQAQEKLKIAQVENSYLDSLLLLKFVTGFSKEEIIFNPNFELSEKQQKDFNAAIMRRSRREPLSHIVNKREFYGLDFFVNSQVLDPRPDSEFLIEEIMRNFPNKLQKLRILEIGVGSGCLVITILKNFPNATAVGVDVSLDALEICRKNSFNHQVNQRLELQQSDLFAKIKKEKFDLIISNPPYIATAEIENLQPEVKLFEPRLALDGGIDGYDFYRLIAAKAKDYLALEGFIVLEIGQNQHEKIKNIFHNYALINQQKDLAQIIRIMTFAPEAD